MKTLLLVVLILVLLLLLGVLGTAFGALWTHFMRRPWRHKPCPRALEPHLGELEAMEEKLRGLGLEDHYCVSGGCRLHAGLLDRGGRRVAVLIHGIEGSARDRYLDAVYYLDRGYSLLFPDLHACGLSEGRWYGMGEFERRDLPVWLALVCARFGPDCRIVLDGVSMGASSALLTAGDGKAQNIAAVVADCGFSSAKEEIEHCLEGRHLPSFPFYPAIRLLMRLFTGYDLNRAEPLSLMRKMRTPVLFIHGEADALVPCSMAREMYVLCASEKELYTVPGASHVGSRVTDRAGCEAKMDEFLSRVMPD